MEATDEREPTVNTATTTELRVDWLGKHAARTSEPYRGPCRHKEGGYAVAVGNDDKHLKLIECAECGSRAWHSERGVTAQWMQKKE